jgi:endoglucanase
MWKIIGGAVVVFILLATGLLALDDYISRADAASKNAGLSKLALASETLTVAQNAELLTITVIRSGPSQGATSVDYAVAVDAPSSVAPPASARTGTIRWQPGDDSPRYFSIPIPTPGEATEQENHRFTVTLRNPSNGATLGSPATASVTVVPAEPLAIKIAVNRFVDPHGNPLQLRGVNVSGLENFVIQGWTPDNPWGNDHPDFAAIKRWKANVVRFPMNQAAWLGLTTYDHDGKPRAADPGKNYRQTVTQAVADAVAAGLYVILDLHWSGPNVLVPGQPTPVPQTPFEGYGAQNAMADADYSLDFWSSVANTFKDNPAVMFELFNEPYFDWIADTQDPWQVWREGGFITRYRTGYVQDGKEGIVRFNWRAVGMKQLLNAVRATGAENVVLVGGVRWAGDLEKWLTHKPVDPLNQMAAVWHAYPKNEKSSLPKYGVAQYQYGKDISQLVPVIITETGDHNTPGTVGSPLVSNVLRWADSVGASYLGWTWNAWTGTDNQLIQDKLGTPTDGYGRYFHDHLVCVGAGKDDCP